MTKETPPKRKLQRGGTLNDRLAQAIGERILSGEFPPGTVLPKEAQWGGLYGVSRTAVREALKSLGAKGLVQSRTKIGSTVEPRLRWNLLDRDVLDWHHAAMDRIAFMRATQEARHLLEPGIAALAARKHTLDQLRALVAAVEHMKTARNISDLNTADIAFHECLLAAANNDLLVPFGIVVEKALAALFEFTGVRHPQRANVPKMHERIARAVAARDEKAARDAMTALLSDTDNLIAGLPGVAAKRRKKIKQ